MYHLQAWFWTATLSSLFNCFSLNDLVLISHDSFYTTKTHRLRRSWRTLESVLKLSLGEILFYDGKIVKTVASGLSFPNGINMSPSMRYYLNIKQH